MYALLEGLKRAVADLADSFDAKAKEFADVLKMGRTQLQDAVPMTLGEEFDGYVHNIRAELDRLDVGSDLLVEVNLGGTAIGTRINTPDGYAELAAEKLVKVTGYPIRPSTNLMESSYDNGAYIAVHSIIKRLAAKISKICNDLRLLSSGPRAGLKEINLPEMQAGSSIMPAKVNPVIPEVVNQICFKVFGNDVTFCFAVEAGQLELNVMEPALSQAMFESIHRLINACGTLRSKCIDGITVNAEQCRKHVTNSIGILTYLNDVIGHHQGDLIGEEAARTGKSVRDVVLKRALIPEERLDEIMSAQNFLHPRYSGRTYEPSDRGLPEDPRTFVSERR